MKNFILLRWLRNISIAKKLYFTMGIMALLIAAELFTLWFAIDTLSAVRAYVGGEGLWSKAQKDAIYHLEKYGHTRNEEDYLDFVHFMEVPGGDHQTRIEMLKRNPDMERARQGFINGRNDPEDVDRMIGLFQRFHRISYISKAIVIWSQADSTSSLLFPIGDSLHREINSPQPSQAKIDKYLQSITPVNKQLTKLEDDFSFTLGEGSRWLEKLIKRLLFSIALTVEFTGLLLTISVSRGIQKGLKEIIRAAGMIERGDLSARAEKFSEDEIGVLSDSFNRMAGELDHSISEQEKNREQLYYQSFMLQHASDVIVATDLDFRITEWNKSAETLFGISRAEALGKPSEKVIRLDFPEGHTREDKRKILRETGKWEGELIITNHEGKKIYSLYTSSVIRNVSGDALGYLSIIRDITERKKTENALKEHRVKLMLAQQLANIGSWIWYLEENKIEWSDELCHIYGFDMPNVLADTNMFIEMAHPADRAMVENSFAEARKNQRAINITHRIIRADGSVRTLHTKGEFDTDKNEQTIRVFGTSQDITERKEEEEMEKLAMAATKSFNSVVITDAYGRIQWVNEGFVRLTGYSLLDVENTHGEILQKGQVTGLTPGTGYYKKLVDEKKPLFYETQNYTRDGRVYWAITTLTPILNEYGQVERIIAIDSDITERKEMENALVQANKISEHSLMKGNKALDELMRAKKALEESMQVKELFMAKMSHEIRTPMNAIMGMTDLMLEEPCTADQKESLDAIKLSADNLLTIINDILDFSKLESGKLSLEMRTFDIREVLDGIMSTMRFSASKKGLAFDYALFPESAEKFPFVKGDATRLRQILLNLVSNSVKFTEDGEVRMEARLLSETDERVTVQFIVSDTGIGIPPEQLDSIFESFSQVNNDISRRYGGTGLGLAIVRQLTELQEGSVSVTSDPGKGSVFTVKLPFSRPDPGYVYAQPEIQPETRQLSGPVKLLLVEDNEMNQVLTMKLLRKWGYEADLAENGKAALEKFSREQYDLILMDIQMPEMDGYETTRYIRQKMPAGKSGVPIIAMTAHAITGEAEKCIGIGMNDYISKPFSQRILFEKISQLLSGKKKTESTEPAAETGKPELTDLSYLHTLSEGNNEFLVQMINAFLRQTPGMLDGMETALEEKNWNDLRNLAHKLKPSVDFMGIQIIREPVVLVEKYAGTATNLEEIPALVRKIVSVCREAIPQLEKKITELHSLS